MINSPILTEEEFGEVNGEKIIAYSIEFPGKLKAKVISYGAILLSLEVPDSEGHLGDVVLGYKELEDYQEDGFYLGATVGRYSGRIANGRFSLNGTDYQLPVNNVPNHLHGGVHGLNSIPWKTVDVDQSDDSVGITFSHVSPDGHEGYPGNLEVEVKYEFLATRVSIEYHAITDKPTIINLTNHSYFNLGGMKRDVLDHKVQVNADHILELDENIIPTGKLMEVEQTPFDFRNEKLIGEDIEKPHLQLSIGRGYDHSFFVKDWQKDKLILVALLSHEESQRTMEVWSTEPTVHLYTGNYLDTPLKGKNGNCYTPRYAVCFETQHAPNSPNEPKFPTVVLAPGQRFYSRTEFHFKNMKFQ